MDPVTLLIIAGSAALKYQANRQADKRRKNFANAMEMFQRQKSKQTEAATEQLLKKQTPEARTTEMADLTRAREDSLRTSVGAAQAFDAPGIAGKTSADYERAQEAQAQSVAERTRRAIQQLAAMGAPGEVKQAHQLRFGKAASQVDAANLASDAVGRAYMSDINNVRPDPFMMMLGDIGMGVGMGRAMGGTGGEAANNGQGFTDAADNLYSGNVTRQLPRRARLGNAFSLWGS